MTSVGPQTIDQGLGLDAASSTIFVKSLGRWDLGCDKGSDREQEQNEEEGRVGVFSIIHQDVDSLLFILVTGSL